jgi:hypothetical protein
MKIDVWLTENDDGEFLVLRSVTADNNNFVLSHLMGTHATLEEAMAHQTQLREDGVPGNSCSAGNVVGFTPLLVGGWPRKKKKGSSLLRRWLKGTDDDRGKDT